MKKTLIELRQLREDAATRITELRDFQKGDNARDLNEAEQAEYEKLKVDHRGYTEKITALEDDEALEAEIIAQRARKIDRTSKKKEDQKNLEQFSFGRALRIAAKLEPMNGVEAEIHQEAVSEARASGQTITGFGVPAMMVQADKRTVEVATPATAGNLVGTSLQPEMIPALRPKVRVLELGASYMGGLVGNIDFKKQTGIASAAWEGEKTEADETEPTTGLVQLRPRRLAAWAEITLQLMLQSSIHAENWIKSELENAIARAIDLAAINGSGAGNQPLGVLNMANINNIAIGADGGAVTRALVLNMQSAIESANADVGDMAYLTTPGVKYALQNTKTDAGSGLFVWDANNINTLMGYRAAVSTQVPGDLTKGTGTALHAALFGVWKELIVAQWGGVDLIVNPYTKAKNGISEVVVNSFWDVNARHEEAFSAIKDIDITA